MAKSKKKVAAKKASIPKKKAVKKAVMKAARFVRIIDLDDPGPEYEFCLINGKRKLVPTGTCVDEHGGEIFDPNDDK